MIKNIVLREVGLVGGGVDGLCICQSTYLIRRENAGTAAECRIACCDSGMYSTYKFLQITWDTEFDIINALRNNRNPSIHCNNIKY